jgi:MFS family permease
LNQNINKSDLAVRICATACGILSVACGLCFIIAALHIYLTGGEAPYSPETVAEHFKLIRVPVYLTLLSVAASGIVSLIYAIPGSKLKGTGDIYRSCEKQREKLSSFSCSDSVVSDITGEINRRIRIRAIFGSVAAVFFAIALIFTLTTEYSTESINSVVIRVCALALPLSLAAICMIFASGILCKRSAERELKISKSAYALKIKEKAVAADCKTDIFKPAGFEGRIYSLFKRKPPHGKLTLQIVLLCCSVGLVILGIFNGSMADVLGKAVRICTECIGLG